MQIPEKVSKVEFLQFSWIYDQFFVKNHVFDAAKMVNVFVKSFENVAD